ncbi:MAG: DNA repair ATPase [Saprospiraceae bacterium]|nr:DNA repair ATPase [Lewinella sp.]
MENTQKIEQLTPTKADVLEAGTYEIIRNRLEQQALVLEERLDQLNKARKEVFGTRETQLLANVRINTANFCVARDMFALGSYCLFGYNVHIGLRSGIRLQDVFSIYQLEDNNLREASPKLLEDEKFQTDFQNLYRYYKDASFVRFLRQDAYLYMLFRVSANAQDIKAFKWLIKEDQLQYIDARSEHEIRPTAQFEFRWQRLDRESHRKGLHPHVSVLERVFVETVGGDLTIKVEDNTDDGLGIYAEEVTHPDQTLDDAEYFYADLGNLILLRIRPYQEDFRYFVFNEKMQEVQRIDTLADSGVLLPDGQGLIFSNGYYLQTGEYKIFEALGRGWVFERRIQSPNGEDFLYLFYHRDLGQYTLLAYNLIAQEVETPVRCHGFALFTEGTMGYFRAEEEPTKHHMIQFWRTPFSKDPILPAQHQDNYLSKIGNKEIVQAMAECREILKLTTKNDTYGELYTDLAGRCTNVLDGFYWINEAATFQMGPVIRELRDVARAAIEEYEKKVSIERNTREAIGGVRTRAENIFKRVRNESFDTIDLFVNTLAELRTLKGNIIALKELRYTDETLIEQLLEEAGQHQEDLSEACIRFLLEDKALEPYENRILDHQAGKEKIHTARDAQALEEELDATSGELQLLIEIVSNLQIADANETTRIIDRISTLFATLNQIRAAIQKQRSQLAGKEAQATFQAQLKLLDQSTVNYLDLADTGKKCDDFLTRLLVQLEELESQFAEYGDFIPALTEKREEIYAAFDSRRRTLTEARQRRTAHLQQAAERILKGISSRLQRLEDEASIHGFFAGDLMVEKVRSIIRQLQGLEDANKAASLQARLKTIREEAVRQLQDRRDLYVDGDHVIKLGKHHFDVNVQPLELSIIERGGALYYHLTGTDFYELIEEPELKALQDVWEQSLVSETGEVYRSEFLAYRAFQQFLQSFPQVTDLPALVKSTAEQGFDEGYTKGIHDEDAFLILEALVELHSRIDLLCFSPQVRAFAFLLWHHLLPQPERALLQDQLTAAGQLLQVFPGSNDFAYLQSNIRESVCELLKA